jgi:hypothetical protein
MATDLSVKLGIAQLAFDSLRSHKPLRNSRIQECEYEVHDISPLEIQVRVTNPAGHGIRYFKVKVSELQ